MPDAHRDGPTLDLELPDARPTSRATLPVAGTQSPQAQSLRMGARPSQSTSRPSAEHHARTGKIKHEHVEIGKLEHEHVGGDKLKHEQGWPEARVYS